MNEHEENIANTIHEWPLRTECRLTWQGIEMPLTAAAECECRNCANPLDDRG